TSFFVSVWLAWCRSACEEVRVVLQHVNPEANKKAAPHLRAARLRGECALAFVSVLRFYCDLARHQQDAGRARSLVIIKSVNEHEENSNTLSFLSRYFALRAGDLSGAKLASTSECGARRGRTQRC